MLLADVPLDGAQFQGGQRAAAHHADHPVSLGVEVHQVLAAPVLVVVAAVVAAGDPAQARAGSPVDLGFIPRRPGHRRKQKRVVGALCDVPVAGARRFDAREQVRPRVPEIVALGNIAFI